MTPAKKLTQIFALIFLAISLASCDTSCVEADEFNVESSIIESKPTSPDVIYGTYDPITGGQRASWHDTGLLSNGDGFLIQISGAWSPLEGGALTNDSLAALSNCLTCARKSDMPNMNCICPKNVSPAPEKGPDGLDLAGVNCSGDDKDDPAKCTCTTRQGLSTDYGVYHFQLNILNKDETLKIADRQTNCKLTKGMNAYIGLFGSRGVYIPKRVYHLLSYEEVCNVVRDSQGRCRDANGTDVTRYVFRSANNRIFMKDDHDGNNGPDTNTGNDEYHSANEVVKTIMWDRYYNDNFGRYNIKFLRGVGNQRDPGLLEYLVRLVEDVLLGKEVSGKRSGGIIEFMFKSIVQDTGFILAVQASLSLYIAFFGAAVLLGIAELSRKELMGRVMKIGLILLFTSSNSWHFYNTFVVGFFKNSLNSLISIIMDLTDSSLDQTTMIKIAQVDRASDASSATRFSYADMIITNLMSLAVAKKVFGLFIGSTFGFLYIPIIYALIFYFIYVMLLAATMYIVNMIKIIFVLCLGPIFMVFTLFSKTAGMFKNWLAFLGGRAIEVIVLFTILYLFINIIDKNFTNMLLYRACGENKGIGPVQLIVLVSYINRQFIDWMLIFLSIGALIFMMQQVINKVAHLAGGLISIGGVGGSSSDGVGHGESGAKMAGDMLSAGFDLGKMVAGGLAHAGISGARLGLQGLGTAVRNGPIGRLIDKISDKMPIRSPRGLARDSIIDAAIKRAEGQVGGLQGKERDMAIRKIAMGDLQMQMHSDPNKMGLLGVDTRAALKRMEQKLVEDPLKKAIKEKAKELKGGANVPLGKDMRQGLRKWATDWAEKNLAGGASSVEKFLKKDGSLRSFVRDQSELTSSEAAKRFAGNEEAKNKYLQHLKDNEFRNARKAEVAARSPFTKVPNAVSRFFDTLGRSAAHNPKLVQENFARKVDREEKNVPWYKRNVLSNINVIDKVRNAQRRAEVSALTAAGQRKALNDRLLRGDGKEPGKTKRSHKEHAKRQFFQSQLRELAVRDLAENKNLDRHELRRQVNAAFDVNDGKNLFEKTARLAYSQYLDRANGDSRDLAAFHNDAVRDHIAREQKNISKALSDGFLSMQEALEERAKLAELHQQTLGGKGNDDKANSENMEKLDEALKIKSDQIKVDLDARIDAAALPADGKDFTPAQAQQAGMILTDFKVEFGQSITDALIKSPDIGLHAGTILLQDDKDKKGGELDPAVINAMKMQSNQLHGRVKMAKLDKALKEFELSKLLPTDPQYSVLQAEIAKLEGDYEKANREFEELDEVIAKAEGRK